MRAKTLKTDVLVCGGGFAFALPARGPAARHRLARRRRWSLTRADARGD